jgi:hypothetical protein
VTGPAARSETGFTRLSRWAPQSVANAPPNGDVLAKAIGSTFDHDPAAPTVISIVGIVVAIAIIVPVRTDVNTARSHVKLHGLRRRRAGCENKYRGERQDGCFVMIRPLFSKFGLYQNGLNRNWFRRFATRCAPQCAC